MLVRAEAGDRGRSLSEAHRRPFGMEIVADERIPGFDDGQIFPMADRGAEVVVLCTGCRARELKM